MIREELPKDRTIDNLAENLEYLRKLHYESFDNIYKKQLANNGTEIFSLT